MSIWTEDQWPVPRGEVSMNDLEDLTEEDRVEIEAWQAGRAELPPGKYVLVMHKIKKYLVNE